jgi:hypothetical protein
MLHIDLPTSEERNALARHRHAPSVSIVLPTTPITPDTDVDRLQFRALAEEAIGQLEAAGTECVAVADLREAFNDLIEDDDFWRFQARSLVVYATPESVISYRLPTIVEPLVAVSDRFHLKPLLRATGFANNGYVLALADGGVRLIEVSADLPAATVQLADLPTDAASAVGKASINDRSPRGRITGSEGKKVRLRQYARQVDRALRERLAGRDVPLVLAAVQSLGAIFRSVNTYPHLVAAGIEGSPEYLSDGDLAQAARSVLDELNQKRLADWRDRFVQRRNEGRASTDVAQVARAATFEAVQSLLVDMDRVMDGRLDETDGRIEEAEAAGASSYGILDEIARRVMICGGEVLGVRQEHLPDASPVAAILRYPL